MWVFKHYTVDIAWSWFWSSQWLLSLHFIISTWFFSSYPRSICLRLCEHYGLFSDATTLVLAPFPIPSSMNNKLSSRECGLIIVFFMRLYRTNIAMNAFGMQQMCHFLIFFQVIIDKWEKIKGFWIHCISWHSFLDFSSLILLPWFSSFVRTSESNATVSKLRIRIETFIHRIQTERNCFGSFFVKNVS